MAELMVLYKTPQNKSAFDKHFHEQHIALVKKMPGLRKYEISEGAVLSVHGAITEPAPYHLIATLHFDDFDAMQKSMQSPEGEAAHADTDNLGLTDILFFNSREI